MTRRGGRTRDWQTIGGEPVAVVVGTVLLVGPAGLAATYTVPLLLTVLVGVLVAARQRKIEATWLRSAAGADAAIHRALLDTEQAGRGAAQPAGASHDERRGSAGNAGRNAGFAVRLAWTGSHRLAVGRYGSAHQNQDPTVPQT